MAAAVEILYRIPEYNTPYERIAFKVTADAATFTFATATGGAISSFKDVISISHCGTVNRTNGDVYANTSGVILGAGFGAADVIGIEAVVLV